MKKTLFSNFLILLVVSTLSLSNTLAEDPTQWNLPEDAKARLGKGAIREMRYSPDGKLLAVASGIGIWLYDVTTRRESALLTEHTSVVDRLAFSPDGRTFASGDTDGTIILSGPIVQLDRSAGAQKTLVGHTHWISSLAFSPDGKTLASGCIDATIHLWDTQTGVYQKTLTGHRARVKSLTFSPDGKTLVSGSEDGSVLIWEIKPSADRP